MDLRRKVDGELETTLEDCRARKRAKLCTDSTVQSTDMELDKDTSKVGVNGLIKRRELVMLIEQALSNLGFAEVSEQLAEESGIKHETMAVTSFRKAILNGSFKQAVSLLERIGLMDLRTQSQCKFLIMEQSFLEVMSLYIPVVLKKAPDMQQHTSYTCTDGFIIDRDMCITLSARSAN